MICNQKIKYFVSLMAIIAILFIAGCGNKQEEAREKLGKMNIEYLQDELIRAIQNDDETVCQLFADAGMNFKDIRLESGRTLLWIAVDTKKIRMIDCLLKNGVDIEAKDLNGETITYYTACYFNQNKDEDLAMLKHLIAKGAKLDVKDNQGIGIVTMAELRMNNEILKKILLDAGAPDDRVEFREKESRLREEAKVKQRREELKHIDKFEPIILKNTISGNENFVKIVDVKNVKFEDTNFENNNIAVTIIIENPNNEKAVIDTAQFFLHFKNQLPSIRISGGSLWIKYHDRSDYRDLPRIVRGANSVPYLKKGEQVVLNMLFCGLREELKDLSNISLYFADSDGKTQEIAQFK